jgi:hypothetical protein
VFERFELPDVAAVARRTMLGALGAGFVGLVVCLLLNQPWVAVGLCIGLAFGMGNFRLIVRAVVKVGRRMEGNKRRPLAMNTLSRLMLMTVVALAILWFVPPLGFGLIAGMALFQFILLANVTRSMLKGGGSGGTGGLIVGLLGGLGSGLSTLGDDAIDAAVTDSDDAPAGMLDGPDTRSARLPEDGRGAA